MKDPAKYATLQDIVEAERQEHAAEWPKVGATLALMWLKRWRHPDCYLLTVELYTQTNCRDTERGAFITRSLLQGSPFHPDPAAESGRWRAGRQQPQPDPGEHHQSL